MPDQFVETCFYMKLVQAVIRSAPTRDLHTLGSLIPGSGCPGREDESHQVALEASVQQRESLRTAHSPNIALHCIPYFRLRRSTAARRLQADWSTTAARRRTTGGASVRPFDQNPKEL